jgi:hypothetical protein
VTGVLLLIPAIVLGNGVGENVASPNPRTFSYDPVDQARTRDVDFRVGPIGSTDLAGTTEDAEDEVGFYERFEDQIGSVLAATKPAEPPSDRSKWMIILIAFAGLTAATSGPRRARRSTMPI